ncbi:MAG TPA: TIGR02757 family protein [Methylomirabilota bacterium]|nr:TIGR02757 family protein [Methylomirabilota bacterium]
MTARGMSPARARLMRGPLERLYRDFDYRGRLARDAIQYPRRYADPLDREIVALLSASLAYGRVDLFGPWIERLLGWLGASPRAFAMNFNPTRDASIFTPFHYRFNRGIDLAAALLAIQRLLHRHGSLRQAFLAGYSETDPDVRPALDAFARAVREQDFRPVGMRRLTRGFRHLFPLPADGGACKRWHLFLRWMVRCDSFDFGDWPEVSPSKLLIPLDTHVANMADALRLTRLRSRTGRMAEDVTRNLRRVDPRDPVKYDFALCHTRMRGDCLGRRAPVCGDCGLRPICRHWR